MSKRALAVAAATAVAVGLVAAPLAASKTRVKRSHHRAWVRVERAKAAGGGNVSCTGVQSTNVPNDLTVPAGATCTIAHTVTVGNDVTVDKGATLIDSGATVKGNVQAYGPKGIGIGGFGTQSATVGGNVTINGASGSGPGTVTRGGNYICNTRIQNNLTIDSSTAGAGPWIVGDSDEECSGGGNLIGRNLTAELNKNRIDISDNRRGVPPYMGGISMNLTVLFNAVTSTTPIVESNFIGDIATCQSGTKMDGDGAPNMVGVFNAGCP